MQRDVHVHQKTFVDRLEYRQAWANWLAEMPFEFFVTLNFNREITVRGARIKFATLLARIDRHFLGPRWHQLGDKRTFAVGVIESPTANLHIHTLVRLPRRTRRISRGERQQVLADHWSTLVPQGSCDMQPIYDPAGVARYIAKQLNRRGHDELFMISTEFHPASPSKE